MGGNSYPGKQRVAAHGSRDDWLIRPLAALLVVSASFGVLGAAGLLLGFAVALWRWLLGF